MPVMVGAVDGGNSVHHLRLHSPALTDGLPSTAAVVQEGGRDRQPDSDGLVGWPVRKEHGHGVVRTGPAGGDLQHVWGPKGLGLVIAQHQGCRLDGGFHLCGGRLEIFHHLHGVSCHGE